MGVTQKLYPPTIGSSIPAFYKNENGTTAEIVVPFSMSRAVDVKQISGFSLKIKTIQSNMIVDTISFLGDEQLLSNIIAKREIHFTWNNTTGLNRVNPGQFLKLQLAYLSQDSNNNNENVPGYYSTVGIIKCTAKPNVYIQDSLDESSWGTYDINMVPAFKQTYVGVYDLNEEDIGERPYSYQFCLYDVLGNLVETSGWLLHNSNVKATSSTIESLKRTIDTYTFESALEENREYLIIYSVKTINGLQISSPGYKCILADGDITTLYVTLNAENIFEEGYINLFFGLAEDVSITDELEDGMVSIEISRAEKTDGFSTWKLLKRVTFSSYDEALKWSFKDFTIEQGITYLYSFRQYQEKQIMSKRILSNEVEADFEDMFLYDGKRQLKIRFNPKVSSFKSTVLESKTDTIGSKYPFIFRNGMVNYKEFPISGLISYLADNNEFFIKSYEDLNILLPNSSTRDQTPSLKDDYKRSITLDSLGYNMRAERKFKLKTLEWLTNGEIKLFKSAAEGNYLIRLMNVSLTPTDVLGRMLHTFNSTAYEVEELTYENLLNLNFINVTEADQEVEKIQSIRLYDRIEQSIQGNTVDSNLSIKLNVYDIIDLLKIETSPSVYNASHFWVRLGSDAVKNKVLISGNNGLILDASGSLPDIYFNLSDNLTFSTSLLSKQNFLNNVEYVVGDSILTYKYLEKTVLTGELHGIQNVYIQNEIFTIVGPTSSGGYVFNGYNDITKTETTLLKFFVLDFQEKPEIVIYYNNGKYYLDTQFTEEIKQFDITSLYRVMFDLEDENNFLRYYVDSNGSLRNVPQSSNYKAKLYFTGQESNPIILYEISSINLANSDFYKIELGYDVFLNCAFQIKKTVYKE